METSFGSIGAPPTTANAATPIVRNNRVFISSDYGTGAGLVEIKADGSAQEVYFTKDMRNHHSSSVSSAIIFMAFPAAS